MRFTRAVIEGIASWMGSLQTSHDLYDAAWLVGQLRVEHLAAVGLGVAVSLVPFHT